MDIPPLLFSKYDIFLICENQKDSLKKAIGAAQKPPAEADDNELISRYIGKYEITVPALNSGAMSVSNEEIDIDISHYPNRMIFDQSRPFFVKGTRVTVHIPFTGEAELFNVRPSTFSLSPPRGLVRATELCLQYQFPNDAPPSNLKLQIDKDVAAIDQNLDRLRESAATLRNELLSVAAAAWQRRKMEFAATSTVLGSLGIPLRTVQQPAAVAPVASGNPARSSPSSTRRANSGGRTSTKWHVFISHATEDKNSIAKPLADALIEAGLEVWYDEYTLTVGDSLRQKIDEGLARSEFGIVILSKPFFAKHWPQQELNGLAAREVDGRKVILPVWHEVTREDVVAASPTLGDRLAVRTSAGMPKVVEELLRAMGGSR